MKHTLELLPPVATRCECCGGLSVDLTRRVARDGVSRATLRATYTNHEGPGAMAMLISLEGVSFFCRLRFTDSGSDVMLQDAADAPWVDTARALTAVEARAHPLKAEVFEIVDAAFATDPSIRGYEQRLACGNAAEPLEYSFRMPDVIHALGAEAAKRAECGKAFASLDGKQFFVRCLVPVEVEGYPVWRAGVWMEVAAPDWQRIREVWDDLERYQRLTFSGAVANDVVGQIGLALEPGARVELHVVDPNEPPLLAAPVMPRWQREPFEQFMLARGFL
jgi:hypothetical protein